MKDSEGNVTIRTTTECPENPRQVKRNKKKIGSQETGTKVNRKTHIYCQLSKYK